MKTPTADIELRVGTRIKLIRTVERYPNFVVEVGATGTVTQNDKHGIAAKMDKEIKGCEEWNNAIIWSDDEVEQFVDDVQMIGYNAQVETAYDVAEKLCSHLVSLKYVDLEERNEDREFFEFTRYGQTTRVIVDIENQSMNVIRFNEHKVVQWQMSNISLDVPITVLVSIVSTAKQ